LLLLFGKQSRACAIFFSDHTLSHWTFVLFLVVRQFLEDSTAAHTLTPHIGLFLFLVVRQFLEDSTAAHTLTPHIGLFLFLVARQFLEDSTLLFEETLAKRDKNKLMKEALETLINLRMKRVDRTLAEVSAQLTNLSKDVKDAKKWTPSHSKA